MIVHGKSAATASVKIGPQGRPLNLDGELADKRSLVGTRGSVFGRPCFALREWPYGRERNRRCATATRYPLSLQVSR